MTYKLSIWYAASNDPQTQILTATEVEKYVRPEVGFLSDLLALKGEGVRKLALEAYE